MNVDWGVLVRVRERQHEAATASLRDALASHAELLLELTSAQAEHERQRAARAAHAAQSRNPGGNGALSLASMQGAQGWAAMLETRIALAMRLVEKRREAVDGADRRVSDARAAWRQTHARLEKSREMDRRARLSSNRMLEQRSERQADELAIQQWSFPHDMDPHGSANPEGGRHAR